MTSAGGRQPADHRVRRALATLALAVGLLLAGSSAVAAQDEQTDEGPTFVPVEDTDDGDIDTTVQALWVIAGAVLVGTGFYWWHTRPRLRLRAARRRARARERARAAETAGPEDRPYPLEDRSTHGR